MNRLEFINALGQRLEPLSPAEISKILDYYVEAVDDRMEDGMTEEAAIESLGDLDTLAAEILAEQGMLVPSAPEQPADEPAPKKKRMAWWTVLLLVLGSPIWLSLGIAALSVALSLYIVAWAVIGSLWAIAVSFAIGGLAGAVGSFFLPVYPNTPAVRILACGNCLALAGVGFVLLPCCLWLTRRFVQLHPYVWRKLRKEDRA